jgi:uncharacterized membrane protein YphA (DoxX/SURF4 family)
MYFMEWPILAASGVLPVRRETARAEERCAIVFRESAFKTSSKGEAPVKTATVIVRVLLGLLFLFASITYFFQLIDPPPATGSVKTFNDGLDASVYLMPTVKILELLCGIAFVVGRFVPLATVLIAPIIVNIALFHAFLAPEGLPLALFLVFANAFVAYQHRDAYRPLLQA